MSYKGKSKTLAINKNYHYPISSEVERSQVLSKSREKVNIKKIGEDNPRQKWN